MYLLDTCDPLTAVTAECNDDAVGLQSALTVPLVQGQTVIVVVDGWGPSSAGDYTLNIR